jgi:hypothetical protein
MATHTVSVYLGNDDSPLTKAYRLYAVLTGKSEGEIVKNSIVRVCKRMNLLNKDGTLNKTEYNKMLKKIGKLEEKPKRKSRKKNPVGRPKMKRPVGRPRMKRPVGRPRKRKAK